MDRMKVVWNDTAKAHVDRGINTTVAGGAYGQPPGNSGVPGEAGEGNGLIVPLFLAVADALHSKLAAEMKVVPYDWRMGPKQFLAPGADYDKLKHLVEGFHAETGQKVVLSGLSMAGFFTHRFLTSQTQ
eukprot:gene18441-62265_t